MSLDQHNESLREAAARLDQISAALEQPETGDAAAVALAKEAAEIAAEVGSIAAEAVRAAAESRD